MSGPLHTFPSDAEKQRTPNLGEVLPPEPEPRNLLSPTGPHYAGGFRIVAECSGFRILERWHPGGPREVERSDQIEAAWWKCLCQGNDSSAASTPDRRAALAMAVDRLMKYAENRREALEPLRERLTISSDEIAGVGGGLGGHVRLGATLGLDLVETIETLKGEENEPAIDHAVGRFRNALTNVARAHGKMPPSKNRKPGRPRVTHAILEAQRQFTASSHPERQLSKSSIRAGIEECGFSYPEQHRKRDWDNLFKQAALGDLPD